MNVKLLACKSYGKGKQIEQISLLTIVFFPTTLNLFSSLLSKQQKNENMRRIILLAGFLLFTGNALIAQTQTPKVNARQKAQRMRIAEGRQDGELTTKEAAVLNQQQRNVRRAERRAKADGQVTLAERARIDRKQDRASRTIRRAKHNKIEEEK